TQDGGRILEGLDDVGVAVMLSRLSGRVRVGIPGRDVVTAEAVERCGNRRRQRQACIRRRPSELTKIVSPWRAPDPVQQPLEGELRRLFRAEASPVVKVEAGLRPGAGQSAIGLTSPA